MISLLQQQDELLQAADLQKNSATHCNKLQHTATYCNILQHTATANHLLQQHNEVS